MGLAAPGVQVVDRVDNGNCSFKRVSGRQKSTFARGRWMKRKRHSNEEIATKLRQAATLAAQGRSQADISKALGVSVMTYHRWRKDAADPFAPERTIASSADRPTDRTQLSRIGELQVENARLRRLVTDLLLEKLRLEEVLDQRSSQRTGRPRGLR
jgi:putative transposase